MISAPRILTGPAMAFCWLVALAAPATAQELSPDHPVRIRAEVSPAQAGPGQIVTLLVTAEIDPEYHIYGLPPGHEATYPTTVKVEAPEGFVTSGETRGPSPDLHVDPTLSGAEVSWYQGTVTFEQDLRVPADSAPGEVALTVGLDHMACTEEFCLDPMTVEATVVLLVTPGSADAGSGDEEEDEEGLGGLIVVAFLGGLFSIALPCVYPLIPLTLAFFSKHEGSRALAMRRAVLFCVGILVTFTGLGVAVGGSLQAIAASLWLNTFLFVLMVALALSLLGMFDIALPSFLTEKMQTLGSGASILSPVFMGVAFSLASFTCTVGVIGPLLAASAAEAGRAAVGMLAYSVGFGLPFFVLALFPVMLSALPKSGSWLNTVKVQLGLFEICFAGYYLWRMDLALGIGVGSWEIVLAVWTVTTFVAGVYLLGKIKLPHDSPIEQVSVPRVFGAILYFSGALYLFGGLMNQITLPAWMEGLLPPRKVTYVAAANGTAAAVRAANLAPKPDFADDSFHPGFGRVWWTTDYEKALELGRRTGRRIFLNFTGIYCSNCRTMEKGIFDRPAVRSEFQKMILVELWTDIPTEAAGEAFNTHTSVETSRRYRELRRRPPPMGYGTTANPYYVVLSPEGERLAESGYESDEDEFVSFLKTGES